MSATQLHTHVPTVATEAWTGARVQARMAEAMAVLRLVGTRVGPTQRVTSWPDIIHDVSEAYGYTPATGVRPRASPSDIARLEEVERWITQWLNYARCQRVGLAADAGYVLTTRAMGWTYGRIAHARKDLWRSKQGGGDDRRRIPGGNSRPSLVLIERRALSHLATALNLSGVPVDLETIGGGRGFV